jgi:hypothetical protein
VKQGGTLDRENKQAGKSKEGRIGSEMQIAGQRIRWGENRFAGGHIKVVTRARKSKAAWLTGRAR